jgi:hypothetical protein
MDKRVGQGLHRQGLGQAGHAFQQHVAAGEQTDEDAVDHGLLAHDDLAHLGGKVVHEGRLLLNHFIDNANVHLISCGGRRKRQSERPYNPNLPCPIPGPPAQSDEFGGHLLPFHIIFAAHAIPSACDSGRPCWAVDELF